MSTVVIGYDASPAARMALELAIARTTPDDKLIVVHAYQLPLEHHAMSYYEDLVERRLDQAATVLDDVESAVPELKMRNWELDLTEGRPAAVLCRVAHDRKADEIVLGTRGHSAVAGLLGSVAHEVLHRAECPVVVVPERAVKLEASSA